MAGLNGLGAMVGLAAVYFRWPELWVAGGFLLAGLAYFWMIMRAWRVMRFLHRSICRRRARADRRRRLDPAYAGPERRNSPERRLRAVEGRLPDAAAGNKDFDTGLARSR
jgi:hypothetical protein